MPHINRIRVNNVKYNVGTQFYDDLCLRFQGKNSLYDLANGGGKSVLMLLLLQNLIPNCTLDDKQPIEKLFRGTSGSNVIHSLIEWDLDKIDREEKGFRFMTTGFCARKKADRMRDGEEEISSSSIEYFNYCIFYNEFQEYDILNLPLTNGNERISYKGLKELLKRLQNESNRRLKVKLFENSKSEYQRFIAGYGLYESQWNIIRGINKTEGHVRAYFETNYRTSRKVVEDLLIEEIIQKAYHLKTGKEQDTEELAQTLLEIREQMVELSNKKQQIAGYDRQIEVIQEFIRKFEPLIRVFEMRGEAEQKTSVFYHLLTEEQERIQQMAGQLEEELKTLLIQKEEIARQLKTLDLQEVEMAFCDADERKRTEEQKMIQMKEAAALLKEAFIKKESVNYYLNYKKALSGMKKIEEEIDGLKRGKEELLVLIEQLTAQKKKKDDHSCLVFSEQKKNAEQMLTELRRQSVDTEEKERRCDKQIAVLINNILETQKRQKELQEEIRRYVTIFPFLLKEQIPEKREALQKKLDELREELKKLAAEKDELTKKIQEGILSERDLEYRFTEIETQLHHLREVLRQYQQMTLEMKARQEVYKEENVYDLSKILKFKIELTLHEKYEMQKGMAEKRKYLEQLEKGHLFQVSEEAEQLREYIYKKYQDGVFGADILEQEERNVKEELLLKMPYLPYAIVVSSGVYEKLKQQPKPEEWKNLSWLIPVVNKEVLEQEEAFREEGVMFAGKEISYFLEQETLEKEIEKTTAFLAGGERKLFEIEEQKQIYEDDLKLLTKYLDQYLEQHETWEKESAVLLQQENQIKKELEIKKEQRKLDEKRLQEVNQCLPQKEERLSEAKESIRQIEALLDVYELYDMEEANRVTLQSEKGSAQEEQQRLQILLLEIRERMAEEEGRLQSAEIQLSEIEKHWQRYKIYYKEEVTPAETIYENLEEMLEGKIASFEDENKDVKEKNRTLEALKEQEKSSLRELKSRKAELEVLETSYVQKQLVKVSDSELEKLRENLEREEERLEKCQNRLVELEKECAGIQTKAEVLEGQLRERYQNIQRLEITMAEIPVMKEQLTNQWKEAQKQYEQLMYEQKRTVKLKEETWASLEKLRWMIEEYQIQNLETTELAGFVVLNKKETERQIHQMWKQMKEKRELAQASFRKARTFCEGELTKLGAAAFAIQMKEQIQIPMTLSEAEQTIRNLQEACTMIEMSRNQIESGLADMEKIKASFENQCLQRCSNIRVELDKFPKLSSIMIDEKLTQIVKLKIPYVKEEQQKMCIEQYLAQVLENLARYESEQEKKRYLMQELSMKRLFSAIVTDMNRISLELYKRERVKEQSRHLRYEEAVGSTGQSQGIYIQFLIAVINYIASMNSYHAGRESLKKVIFIDNPFGAAKDTYIWEPIFAMLAANRVQLIVPTRGATPAIIGKFDVNYLLGQKMVGAKQQTVIVDYRSKIEAEETEYVKIEYQQETLF